MPTRRRTYHLLGVVAASLVAAAGVAAPSLASPARATPRLATTMFTAGITVTELPGLGGERARPEDINERGLVAGEATTASGERHAVVWDLADGGTPVDLTPTPPGEAGRGGSADFVNRRGVVAGTVGPVFIGDTVVWRDGEATAVPPGLNVPRDLNDRGEVLTHAFDRAQPWLLPTTHVWRDGELAVAPSPPDGAPFVGLEVSNRGTVLGQAFGAGRVTTWRPGEPLHDLALPEGALSARPVAINDADVVVGIVSFGDGRGERVVRWLGGVPTELGTLGGASSGQVDTTNTVLSPINVWGHVVGSSETATGEHHAFLWRYGRMSDLGTLGGTFSVAQGVNDVGQVVGVSSVADGNVQHPFLWQNGRMLDLTTVPGLEHLVEVTDINNRGELVGVVDAPGAEPRAVAVRVPPWASLRP